MSMFSVKTFVITLHSRLDFIIRFYPMIFNEKLDPLDVYVKDKTDV